MIRNDPRVDLLNKSVLLLEEHSPEVARHSVSRLALPVSDIDTGDSFLTGTATGRRNRVAPRWIHLGNVEMSLLREAGDRQVQKVLNRSRRT